mmetsp:Transcript_19034/g.65438  ORF Transcript_19034/g.65438 Transcript_19034/m.65438 type:complete len:246 (+) Transcript_19034:2424-3161(+)
MRDDIKRGDCRRQRSFDLQHGLCEGRQFWRRAYRLRHRDGGGGRPGRSDRRQWHERRRKHIDAHSWAIDGDDGRGGAHRIGRGDRVVQRCYLHHVGQRWHGGWHRPAGLFVGDYHGRQFWRVAHRLGRGHGRPRRHGLPHGREWHQRHRERLRAQGRHDVGHELGRRQHLHLSGPRLVGGDRRCGAVCHRGVGRDHCDVDVGDRREHEHGVGHGDVGVDHRFDGVDGDDRRLPRCRLRHGLRLGL